jgi:hypothetical protein
VFTPLSGWHRKLCPNTKSHAAQPWIGTDHELCHIPLNGLKAALPSLGLVLTMNSATTLMTSHTTEGVLSCEPKRDGAAGAAAVVAPPPPPPAAAVAPPAKVKAAVQDALEKWVKRHPGPHVHAPVPDPPPSKKAHKHKKKDDDDDATETV